MLVHGDRELAYNGNPETGEPTEGGGFEHWIWDVAKVKALVADHSEAVTFFCGGSRNLLVLGEQAGDGVVDQVDETELPRRCGAGHVSDGHRDVAAAGPVAQLGHHGLRQVKYNDRPYLALRQAAFYIDS
jgi:hypothetical protein